jgi:hypothetical protein
LALYVDIAPDGIESVRPNYTFALGPFALGSFALKVGPFALIIKSILMNIINIVIEIKEVTIGECVVRANGLDTVWCNIHIQCQWSM